MLAELRNVTRRFDQPASGAARTVLDDISLLIREKDSIAITGPSGSGKSTLLNILGTLDRPTSGSVLLNGADTGPMSEDDLAALRSGFVGFVFQLHHLLPQLTLLENLMLPTLALRNPANRQSTLDRALSLAGRVGLSGHIHHRPFQLSVGECQRAALVRALINRPKLLLADEPTGSLDAANASMMADLLADLNREQGVALVVATHSPDLADRMERKFRLVSGNLQPVAAL